MNKLLLLACASTITSAALATGCTVVNQGSDAGTGDNPDTGTAPGLDGSVNDSSSPPGDGATDTTAPGTDGGVDSTTTTDTGTPPGDTGGTTATSCSTGKLFAGDPTYVGDYTDRPTSGTGILADPPMQWQNMVFNNGRVYTRDDGELWSVDLSVASPVETRVAGHNGAALAYAPGPCSSALMAKIEGIGALPDKSIVLTDSIGNAVLHVANPTTSACTVEFWAGNATTDSDLSAVKNPGDAVGPGATAQFDGPGALVTDDSGNVYVWDSNNLKIKKIANDAAHTVSTLVKMPSDGPDNITNMTRIGSKIYAMGQDGVAAFVLAIDTGTGAITTVIKGGGGTFPPVDSTTYPAISGITTDGTGLMISGKGYIWYLTTSGTLTHIAGAGNPIDFPPSGYDAKASHPALDVVLGNSTVGSISGSQDYITYFAGALYFRGKGDGTASYVEKFSCP